MYILDTDHISLFQRNDPHLTPRILATPALTLTTTIITVEEQLRGRLDRVRRAKTDVTITRAYQNLGVTAQFFQTITVIGFDKAALNIVKNRRAQKIRVGTQDMRIAAITLSQNATLLTRYQREKKKIPSLKFEDWSIAK